MEETPLLVLEEQVTSASIARSLAEDYNMIPGCAIRCKRGPRSRQVFVENEKAKKPSYSSPKKETK